MNYITIDTKLVTLLYKENDCCKIQKVKSSWFNSRQTLQDVLGKAMVQKGCFTSGDDE
jgi:hypothetical protein